MENESTLGTTTNNDKQLEEMVKCIAIIPEHNICGKIFPKKEAHYIGGPHCPPCYERWFYQQD